jgi:hypothetical protein
MVIIADGIFTMNNKIDEAVDPITGISLPQMAKARQ